MRAFIFSDIFIYREIILGTNSSYLLMFLAFFNVNIINTSENCAIHFNVTLQLPKQLQLGSTHQFSVSNRKTFLIIRHITFKNIFKKYQVTLQGT